MCICLYIQTYIGICTQEERRRQAASAFTARVNHLKEANHMAELVEGLRAHVDDHAAALAACQAMARLIAGEHGPWAEKAAARIAAAGGIEAVVRVFGEHHANAYVVRIACRTLFYIGMSDQALQKRIKNAGAEPLVRVAVLAAPDAGEHTKKQGQELLCKLGKV